ncbi:hypothetical protein BJX70DRAFT_130732 [Aspergillus crustosus]
MLKPFLIRDLHEEPQPQDLLDDAESDLYNATDVSVGPQRRHGLVRLAAADYDEIAYIHPQARLTYLDDDDGEIITVGSSLELAQRLDEPPPQITNSGFQETIHLFDIRRRRSVTDLWKRFEHNERTPTPEFLNTGLATDDLSERATALHLDSRLEQTSHLGNEQASTARNDTSESLLSAFEAEMARVMTESQPATDNNITGSTSSSRPAQPESTSNFRQDTTEAFNTALRNIIEVAELISSGVRSKVPELERHLENARRALPSDITDSMWLAFLTFEQQVKAMASTLNNLPETLRGDSPAGARRFPEIPMPANAMHGLREMGVQINSMSQTIFDAFESGVRGAFPSQRDGLLFNFPGFFEPDSHNTSVPNNAEEHSFTRLDNNSPTAHPNLSPPLEGGFWIEPSNDSHSNIHEHNNFSWGHHHPHRLFNRPYLPPMSLLNQRPGHAANFDTSAQPHQNSERHTSSESPSHESNPSRSLFMGNIGFNVTEKMIKDVFSSKGLQVEVNLLLDSRTSRHAGFGYLTFLSPAEAAVGLRDLQGIVIDGHCANLEYVDHTPITSLAETSNPTNVASLQTSGVVRHGTTATETASDGPLAFTPDNTNPAQPSSEIVHDLLLAQTEARFPPVSQLDAHMLAEQSSGTRRTVAPEGPRTVNAEESDVTRRRSAHSFRPPGSFPQDTYDGLVELPTEAQPASTTRPAAPLRQRHPHHHHHHPQSYHPRPYPQPRRAATVRSMDPRDHLVDNYEPFDAQPGLRRRATERHSLRGGPLVSPMFPRHRASFHNLSHGQPAPEQPHTPIPRDEGQEPRMSRRGSRRQQRAIAECVSALNELGYGSEENGGLQRMEMYAAAAHGELVDAIEMIEEERKAYEQRG